jgi:hypothetical protein
MIYGLPITLILTAVSCLVLAKTYIKDAKPIVISFLDDQKTESSVESPLHRKIVIAVNLCYCWIMAYHLLAWF